MQKYLLLSRTSPTCIKTNKQTNIKINKRTVRYKRLKTEKKIAKLEIMLFLTDKNVQNKITMLIFFIYNISQSKFIKNALSFFNNGAGTTGFPHAKE